MKKHKVIFVLLSLLSAFLLTFIIDRIIGLGINAFIPESGLLFSPNSLAHYNTKEFDYTAHINKLGFRDRDFSLNKTADIRVLTIGDSFTYGWGVKLHQSWPKILEKNLLDMGLSVEIANLGKPGASPINYANTAKRAIPLLKPDIVLVGILQSEDVAQIIDTLRKRKRKNKKYFSYYLRKLYPNIMKLVRKQKKRKEIWPVWKKQSKKILSIFDEEEMERFNKLDSDVKDAFADGDLNPMLIASSVIEPEHHLEAFHPEHEKPGTDLKQALIELSKSFSRIKRVADKYQATVIIVSIPFPFFVSYKGFENMQRIGFVLDKNMLTSRSADKDIMNASREAGLLFFNVTRQFRQNSKNDGFYFELDAHLTPSGHKFYADMLTPILAAELRK